MDDEFIGPQEGDLVSHPPVEEDLTALCRKIKRLGAKFPVVGGVAILQAGYLRPTGDVDVVVAADLGNKARIAAQKPSRGMGRGPMPRKLVEWTPGR